MTDNSKPYARFRSRPGVALLRFENPKGGKVLDLYGGGRLIPREVTDTLEQERIHHLLDKGLIEFCDDAGSPTDPGRVQECWCALVSLGVPEDAGRPRAAAILRDNDCHYSNQTISSAIALHKAGWKFGDPFPEQPAVTS